MSKKIDVFVGVRQQSGKLICKYKYQILALKKNIKSYLVTYNSSCRFSLRVCCLEDVMVRLAACG